MPFFNNNQPDTLSPRFRQQRKFLLIAPAIALPGLFAVFYVLGGGQGPQKNTPANSILGFNTELPKVKFDRKEANRNKLEFYEKADEDSLRKKEYLQRDPYRKDTITAPVIHQPAKNPDELLRRLDQLKQTLGQPASLTPTTWSPSIRSTPHPITFPTDTPPGDPQLEKLNTMLDKVLRIQHPAVVPSASHSADELMAADSSNTLPAVVQDNTTLTTGATIALRLTQEAFLNGTCLSRGQLIYGVVNINGDRMQINISSIRSGYNIYSTDLQVYDMDGLPGIHIPGMLTREVTKQSADQGVDGLNILSLDPSFTAQAANAGLATAKSLFSKKVRMVRVSLRAGYQVLLRNTRSSPHSKPPHPDLFTGPLPTPPANFPWAEQICSFRSESMELDCRSIGLHDGCLWFAIGIANRSPIAYAPEYTRWFIRDRRQFRRTASQDLSVQPVFDPTLRTIPAYDTCQIWTGFHPFALSSDKELVLQIGEKNNGRLLTIVIGHKEILKAKNL